MKIRKREKTKKHHVTDALHINTAPVQAASSSSPGVQEESLADTPEALSVAPWESAFNELLSRPETEDISTEFDILLQQFAEFLFKSIQQLKGPKHPNTRFYEARQDGRARKTKAGFSRSSNPARRDHRRREKARARYRYELVQYQYYNTRRRAVRTVLNSPGDSTCKVPLPQVEQHFRSLLEVPNDAIRDTYENCNGGLTGIHDGDVTAAEIRESIKGMAPDTSPGPDRVLLRAVKALKCESSLALIATIMYRRSLVPQSFGIGLTVLIDKGGDRKSIHNWRPITIFSVLRRIVERTLDRRLRGLVQFDSSQSGFVRTPGTYINSSLVQGVLRSAKKKKGSCVLVFLDVSKAFDNIGHAHIRRTLDTLPLPTRLRDLIYKLCENNTTQVQVGHEQTKRIHIRRGVPQGAPLSPAVFNLCLDFMLRELTADQVADECGYVLDEGLSPLSVLAFADDIVLIARDLKAARRLLEVAVRELQTIGLDLNIRKSQAVVIEKGNLRHFEEGLTLHPNVTLNTLAPNESIRYLGVDFESEIILDEVRLLKTLKTNLDTLTNSDLLHSDQKLNVVNNFIWPALIYPLQTAPLHTIKSGFLEDIDKLIRGAVKQFCNLPMDTPTAMLYAPHNHRGLGLVRASWEAFLQHINITEKLQKAACPHVDFCEDHGKQIATSMSRLDLSSPHCMDSESQDQQRSASQSVKALRASLRQREFERWCALPFKGQGVEVFAEVPTCNTWVLHKSDLSTSEWTNALKMSTNGCNLRSNPRTASSTFHCRHCSEFESLPHMLGKCPRGELLRNNRHHRICDTIATELNLRGCTVLREDHVADENHGSRFTDLVVVDPISRRGFLLDPTVRFERSTSQAAEVNAEKHSIYQHTIPVYRQRFPEVQNWQVVGLLFGARGAVPTFTADFLTSTLGLSRSLVKKLGLFVLKDSLGILQHHLYNREGA